jgi:hypothetical protein
MRRLAVLTLVLCLAASGCATPTLSTTPTPTASAATATPAASEPVTPAASLTPRPTACCAPPGQSESAWGRLWDAIPAGFPVPVGASPTDVAEPVSAAFDLAMPVSDAATFMQGALEAARYSTIAFSGPLEDGTVVIDSVGPTSTDCLVETSIAPMGGLTRLTIRFGAACPFE